MFPHERSLVKKLDGKPFVLIGVNGDPAEGLKEKNEKQGITWRSFKNERDEKRGSIATEFNLRGWPTLYYIDHTGVIRAKNLREEKDIEEMIDLLVEAAEKDAKKGQK